MSTLKIAWYFLSFQSTIIFQAQNHIDHFNGLLLGGLRENLVPCVHLLSLSLNHTIRTLELNTEPDIIFISEYDLRVSESMHYKPPALFPLLDMHFSGQNGAPPLSIANGPTLTPADNCRECQSSRQQNDPATRGDATSTARRRSLKHRRASSGGTHGNSLIFNTAKSLISTEATQ